MISILTTYSLIFKLLHKIANTDYPLQKYKSFVNRQFFSQKKTKRSLPDHVLMKQICF